MKRRFIGNIILSAISIAVLSIVGSFIISDKNSSISQQSSYSLTAFDYVVVSPSYEQEEEIKSNREAVKSTFSVYNFKTNLNGGQIAKVSLLLGEDINSYDTGLFNNKTLLSGEFKEDGIMVDETAAKKLGVVVGDDISVTLANTNFIFEVCSIYIASSYQGLDEGLAIAKFSDDIHNAFGRDIGHDMMFLEANNKEQCQELLKDYVPLGPLQSEDEYVAEYKEGKSCPPSMTEEEWDESIKKSYQSYRESYLSQDFSNSVQAKEDYMEIVKDKTSTYEERVKIACIIAAISSFVVYAVVSCSFIFINKKVEIENINNGETMITKRYAFINGASAIITSVAVAVILLVVGFTNKFIVQFVPIILSFSLPVLATLLVSIPIILSVKDLKDDNNNKSKNTDYHAF